MSACDQVLNLPELLEYILLEVPMRDLLLAQRVCKTWQTAAQSTKIQRKLFFQPMVADEVPLRFLPVRSEDGSGPPDSNAQYIWTRDPSPSTKSIPVRIYENPAFSAVASKMVAPPTSFARSPSLLPEQWQRPEASWRLMLVTQPSLVAEKVSMSACGPYNYGPYNYYKCCWNDKRQLWRSTCAPTFPQQLGMVFDFFCGAVRPVWQKYHDKGVLHLIRPPVEIRFGGPGTRLWEQLPDQGWLTKLDAVQSGSEWKITTMAGRKA